MPGNHQQPQHNDYSYVFTWYCFPACQYVGCSPQQAKPKNLQNEYDEIKETQTYTIPCMVPTLTLISSLSFKFLLILYNLLAERLQCRMPFIHLSNRYKTTGVFVLQNRGQKRWFQKITKRFPICRNDYAILQYQIKRMLGVLNCEIRSILHTWRHTHARIHIYALTWIPHTYIDAYLPTYMHAHSHSLHACIHTRTHKTHEYLHAYI